MSASAPRKGIILAGGSGTRLHPAYLAPGRLRARITGRRRALARHRRPCDLLDARQFIATLARPLQNSAHEVYLVSLLKRLLFR